MRIESASLSRYFKQSIPGWRQHEKSSPSCIQTITFICRHVRALVLLSGLFDHLLLNLKYEKLNMLSLDTFVSYDALRVKQTGGRCLRLTDVVIELPV